MRTLATRMATAGAVAWAIIAPLTAFFGVNLTGDDVLYGRLAADMAFESPSFFPNPHPCRLGLIAPLSILYKAFGVNEWTTVALTVACTICAVCLSAFAANRLYGRSAAAWAAVFCSLHPILYRYGTMGMADVPAGFGYGLFVVGWVLVAADRVRRRRLTAFLSGAACAWAMATRETTAPMAILTIGGFAVYGWCRIRNRGFPLLPFFLGGCIIGLPYLSYIWFHTGSPFYGLHAAQISYNLPGAPWLEPLEGARFWFRLLGFSLLRSAVEGYLVALVPVVLLAVFIRKAAFGNDIARINLHLFMAIVSPLVVLSHFPTTCEYWNPIRLDLRFGSPVIVPACILTAGICTRLPQVRFASLTRLALWILVACLAIILLVGIWRQNVWTIAGALESLVVAATLFCAQYRLSKLLPCAVSMMLICNWGGYRLLEYPERFTINQRLWREGVVAFQDPQAVILTDHITAQYVSFLNRYSLAPRIVTWKIIDTPAATAVPGAWAEQIEHPWPERCKVIWYPLRAKHQSGLWGGNVPSWVIEELLRARLLVPLTGDPEVSFGRSPEPSETEAPGNWPKAGLYLIENPSSK